MQKQSFIIKCWSGGAKPETVLWDQMFSLKRQKFPWGASIKTWTKSGACFCGGPLGTHEETSNCWTSGM
jgi:hypothetical protein